MAKKKPKRKRRKRPPVWTIEQSEWSIGKPTHMFVLEVTPAPYDDVVHHENYTKGFITKNELFFDFVDDHLRNFFRDELPEGCLYRGRVVTFIRGIHDAPAKKDVASEGVNKGDNSGSSGSPDEEVRTPS